MPKSRKQYSPSEKAAILREHLIDRLPQLASETSADPDAKRLI